MEECDSRELARCMIAPPTRHRSDSKSRLKLANAPLRRNPVCFWRLKQLWFLPIQPALGNGPVHGARAAPLAMGRLERLIQPG
jgi:hypothetical protein